MIDRSVRSFFDKHADSWDETTYSPEQRARIPGIIDSLSIRAGQTVLDVGTGTGILIPLLQEKIQQTGRIVAIDISLKMLKSALTIASATATSVYFIQSMVEFLPMRAETVDVTVCFSVFPHFNHHPRALQAIHRVTRSGGRLYILHLEGSTSLNRFHSQIDGAVRHHRLPGIEKMTALLTNCQWEVMTIRDTDSEYLVEARKDS